MQDDLSLLLPGTLVGQIVAMDNDLLLDNNEIMYSITSGNEDDSLVLDPVTGNITTSRPFDQEVIDRLTLTVEAKNAKAQSGIISDTSIVSCNNSNTFNILIEQILSAKDLKSLYNLLQCSHSFMFSSP